MPTESCASASPSSAPAVATQPAKNGSLDPLRSPTRPTSGASMSETTLPGTSSSPAWVAERPKPTSPPSGNWASCGTRTNVLIIAEPTSRVEMLVVRTGRRASVFMLISGSRVRRSKKTKPTRTRTPAASSASVAARAPAPVAAARDANQQGGEAGGQDARAREVDAPRRAHRRLGDEQVRRDRRQHAHDRAEPEDPVVARAVGEHAAERQADAGADRGDRAEQRDAGRHALGGELVADDPERQREHAAAEALQAAADDHQAERARERARRPSRRRTAPARSPAAAPCRTCRRGGRRSASRSRRPAGTR